MLILQVIVDRLTHFQIKISRSRNKIQGCLKSRGLTSDLVYYMSLQHSRECTIYVARGMSCVCVKGRVLCCCNFMKKVWIKNANSVEGLTESGQWLATNFLGQRAEAIEC